MLLWFLGGAKVDWGVDWMGLVDTISKDLFCLRKHLIYPVVQTGVVGAEQRRIPELIAWNFAILTHLHWYLVYVVLKDLLSIAECPVELLV